MSEAHEAERASDGPPVQAAEIAPPDPEPERPHRASRRGVLWLAALLALSIGGVALSPFWTPEVAPLLPWGPGISAEEYAALAARVRAIEMQPGPSSGDADAVRSLISSLSGRVDRLETAVNSRLADLEKRPAEFPPDFDTIKSAVSALGRRVDQLEAARPDSQIEAAIIADRAAVPQLEQRVAAVEELLSSRTAGADAEIQKLEKEVFRLDNSVADIAQRVPTIERQMQAQIGNGRRDAVAALLLLQMREAVERARPFPTAYSAFKALSRDPELVAAAEPLAAAAQNGVASRSALGERLADLAGQIATATEPPPQSDWGAQALAQLRGLVTIRRIDGASQSAPEAAVSSAQTALARGDLAGAVSALEALTGANAEAARPWLQMARERLSTEIALDRLQALLTANIDNPASAPAEPTKGPS
jgi:hypothetical protein